MTDSDDLRRLAQAATDASAESSTASTSERHEALGRFVIAATPERWLALLAERDMEREHCAGLREAIDRATKRNLAHERQWADARRRIGATRDEARRRADRGHIGSALYADEADTFDRALELLEGE